MDQDNEPSGLTSALTMALAVVLGRYIVGVIYLLASGNENPLQTQTSIIAHALLAGFLGRAVFGVACARVRRWRGVWLCVSSLVAALAIALVIALVWWQPETWRVVPASYWLELAVLWLASILMAYPISLGLQWTVARLQDDAKQRRWS